MQLTTTVAAAKAPTAAPTTNEQSQETSQLQRKINTPENGSDGVDKTTRSPFQREVREWQHIDPDTGALLTKRLEADRWINGPLNKYGKISNSKNIAQPNGTQHTQRKQVELLESCTNDGGAFQLIRTQSSSRWSSASVSPAATSTNTSPTIATTSNTNEDSHNDVRIEDDYDDDDCIDVTDITKTQNNINEQIPIITVTETMATTTTESSDRVKHSLATNKVKAENIVVSENSLEICEVSDTEIENVDYIDSNGIVIDADDIVDNIAMEDDDDDDHDHEVYYHGKRVFDIKVQLADDYERPNLNGNNDVNHKNYYNNNHNNKNFNSTHNKNHYNNSNNNAQSNKNSSIHTTSSIKLSNLMKSNSSTSSTSSNNSKATSTTTKTRLCEKSKINTNVSTTNKVSLRTVVGKTNINHNNKSNRINIVKNAEKSISPSIIKLESPSKQQPEKHRNIKQESLLCSGNKVFEQPAIYSDNNSNNNNTNLRRGSNNENKLISVKSRVGANIVSVTNELIGSNVGGEEDNNEQQQNKAHLTPTLEESQQKHQQELESFRLYNHGIALSINGKQHHNDELSSLTSGGIQEKTLQRSHSISTDDLSNDTNEQETLSDWRRVTKLRRSFQSNSTASSDSVNTQQSKPTDLPVNSVSVERMRAELEQGRRLQTTMRKTEKETTPTSTTKTSTMVTAETLQDIRAKLKKLSDDTLYKADYLSSNEPTTLIKLTDLNETTNRPNSLAARQKARASVDLIDWQNRRKSYGFEKMLPAEHKSNTRMDASTDSGLGRSGDIGNWSPTSEQPRSTVVHLGQSSKVNIIPDLTATDDLIKRHSIAVDASKYVGDNTIRKPTQIQLQQAEHINRGVGGNGAAGKRVEFCKTEVHFAAESGRVNIVETDGKPPPTNNFRRRRRVSSGPLQTLVKHATPATNNLPIKRFGDDQPAGNNHRASLSDLPDTNSDKVYNSSSYISTAIGNDITDNETDDISSLRGILKNRPIKPKPYHLGENISSADVLWGVQLKPIGNADIDNAANKSTKTHTNNGYSTKINLNMDENEHNWPGTDHFKTNVMNIELHSPQFTVKNLEPIKVRPLPKPRTVSVIQNNPVQVSTDKSKPIEPKESLKIVKEARGARKLRDHELSYFGIQILNNPTSTQNDTTQSTTSTNSLRRSLPSQHRNSINEPKNISKTHLKMPEAQDYNTTLLNDKPDLLKHNAIIYPAERKILNSKKTVNNEQNCYENISNKKLSPVFKIKQPSELKTYDRKSDTLRDARNLSEMSYNADQTLKSVSKEMSVKDQRRHSMRRPSTPLETIDERSRSQQSCNSCIAVKALKQVPSPAPIRHTAASRSRSSSFSSVDSCPKARSRSHSGDKQTKITRTKMSPSRLTLGKSYHEDSQRSHSLESRKRETVYNNEPIKILCQNCSYNMQSKEKRTSNDKERIPVPSTTRSSSRELARCTPEQSNQQHMRRDQGATQRSVSRHSTDNSSLSAGGSGRSQRREGTSSTQKSFRKLTSALGLSKSSADKTSSKTKSTEIKHVEKSYENKSRGDSNRSSNNSSSERQQKTLTNENRKSAMSKSNSKHKKEVPDMARYSPMTYVYETNITNTENNAEYLEIHLEENDSVKEQKFTFSSLPTVSKTPPQKPPRKKNKQKALQQKEEKENATQPLHKFSFSDPLPALPAEAAFLPYSQQSTLRKDSLPRFEKDFSAFLEIRKPYHKSTYSSNSSFAFMPNYLPPKRNSNVSHVYDNYLLYASTPLARKRFAYQHQLVNEHAYLFGSAKRQKLSIGNCLRPQSMRTIRRSVRTLQPFSLCTCS